MKTETNSDAPAVGQQRLVLLFDIPKEDWPSQIPQGSHHMDLDSGEWIPSYMVGHEVEHVLRHLDYPKDSYAKWGIKIPEQNI